MALIDRLAVLAPYAEQLLYNQEVQDAIGRAVDAGRGAYDRARGESASQAVQDKKLRRRLQQAIRATGDARSAIADAPRRRKRGRRFGLTALVVVGAGAFVVAEPRARERVFGLIGKGDATTSESAQ